MYIKPKHLTPPTHSPFWGVILSGLQGKYISEKTHPRKSVIFCENISFVSKQVSKASRSGNQRPYLVDLN